MANMKILKIAQLLKEAGTYFWRKQHNDNSPLFKLPAELCIIIWELCLLENGPISARPLEPGGPLWSGNTTSDQESGLLRTCRLSRRECIKI